MITHEDTTLYKFYDRIAVHGSPIFLQQEKAFYGGHGALTMCAARCSERIIARVPALCEWDDPLTFENSTAHIFLCGVLHFVTA